MAQQLLVNGETYGSHRNKVNANETELYAAVASAQAVANAAIPAAQKAAANGVASLDGSGKVPSGQLPAAAPFTLAAATDVASFDLATTNTAVAAVKATANAAIPSSQKAAANGVATLGSDTKVPTAQMTGKLAISDTTDGVSLLNAKQNIAVAWTGTSPALASGVNPITAGFGSNTFVYTGTGMSPSLDGSSGPNGTIFIFGVGGTSTWSAWLNGAQYLGIYATSGALPASPAPMAIAYVGASAPYAIWQYNGSAWVQQVTSAMVAAANGVASLDGSGYVPASQSGALTGDVTRAAGTNTTVLQATAAALLVQSTNAQTGTTYTLVLTDAGQNVDMNSASANTLTIPLNSSVPFPLWTLITVTQVGTGTTTIAGAGGVTLVKPSADSLSISAQYRTAQLYKTATDTWRVLAN